MKALVYNGPHDVSVENVEDPKIERATDVLVKITSTNICGSDLHMYEGRTDFEQGRTLSHENLGEVVEVGDAVDKVQVGDMVCLPFNIACGHCKNCERGLTNYCITMQPMEGMAGATYGFADMGPYQGGQAEYLRVPYGDFNCLILPEDAREKENDYVMLADIWPTGYHATEMAGVQPGDSVVVYGAGPVGLHGRLLRDAQERQQGHDRGSPPRPAAARGADRRHPHRRLGGIAGRAGHGADQRRGRGPRLRVRGLPGARPKATSTPT